MIRLSIQNIDKYLQWKWMELFFFLSKNPPKLIGSVWFQQNEMPLCEEKNIPWVNNDQVNCCI